MRANQLILLLIFVSISPLNFGCSFSSNLDSKLTQTSPFLDSTRYHGASQSYYSGAPVSPTNWIESLKAQDFTEITLETALSPLRFWAPSSKACLFFKQLKDPDHYICSVAYLDMQQQALGVVWDRDELQKIHAVFAGDSSLAPTPFGFIFRPLIYQGTFTQPIFFEPIQLSSVPVICLQSILVTEDQDFLEHKGLDWRGIARAMWVNLRQGRFAQGGSTLTQQYIKNAFLSNEKTLKRKVTEALLAIRLEKQFSKDQIFERYLNVVYLGQAGAFELRGVGAAARHYFEKEVSQLDLAECTLIAALLKGPNQYHPLKHPQALQKRRAWILGRLLEQDFITDQERQIALPNPKVGEVGQQGYIRQMAYYLDAAQKTHPEIEAQEQVFLAVNPEVQSLAQRATQTHLTELTRHRKAIKKELAAGNPLQASVVVVNRHTHLLEAIVSGANFSSAPYARALYAKRPIGSLIKPFVYYLALVNDPTLDSQSWLQDEALEVQVPGGTWKPENYDRQFRGEVSLETALAQSLNIPAVRLGMQLGPSLVLDKLHEWVPGIDLNTPHPSMLLGAIEMSPLEVAKLYLAMDSAAELIEPLFLIPPSSPAPIKALHPHPNERDLIYQILIESGRSGTSKALGNSPLFPTVFGKTGTTSDYKDAWFLGYTPEHIIVVWTGFDNNAPTGLTGASGALPLFKAIAEGLAK